MVNLAKHIKQILLIALLAFSIPTAVSFAARTDATWNCPEGTNYCQPNINPAIGSNIFINGSNHYINFGSASGVNGYGLRDNGGTMQYKNSGGSWLDIGSGGGGGGSGTVNAGTTGQFPYYAANGTALSPTSVIFISGSNIGINKTNPFYPLDVNGTARVFGDIRISGSNTIRQEDNPLYLQTDTTNPIIFRTSVSSEKARITDAGNFGIGTNNPNAKLDVAGNINGYYITVQNGESRFGNAGYTDPAGGYGYDAKFGGSGRGIAVSGISTFNSNVGIGTVTPGDKLNVVGNVRVGAGQNLYFGDGGSYQKIQSYAGQKLSINPEGNQVIIKDSTGTSGSDLDVANSINARTRLNVNDQMTNRNSVIATYAKNSANPGGTYFSQYTDADNSIVGNRMWSLYGYLNKTTDGTTYAYEPFIQASFPTTNGTSAYTKQIELRADNYYINGGKIGIDTTTPGEKISIANGNISLSGGSALCLANLSQSCDNNWRVGRDIGSMTKSLVTSNASTITTSATANEGFVVGVNGGNSSLEINGTGLAYFRNKVGIGSTTPTYPLSMNGDIGVSLNNKIIGPVVNGDQAYLQFGDAGTGSRLYFSGQFIDFNSSVATRFNGGSLEINNGAYLQNAKDLTLFANGASSGTQLQNSGKYNLNSRYWNTSTVSSRDAVSSQQYILSSNSSNQPKGRLAFSFADTEGYSNIEAMSITNTGNIGIGTTSPSQKFSVNGASLLHGAITQDVVATSTFAGGINITSGCFSINGTCVTGGGGGGSGTVNSGSAYTFPYYASTGTTLTSTLNLTTDSSGKIGVGLLSASLPSKLTVNGNVSIGAAYNATAAPTDGLIVAGQTGIGVSAPTAYLQIGDPTASGTTGGTDLFSIVDTSNSNANFWRVQPNGRMVYGGGAGTQQQQIQLTGDGATSGVFSEVYAASAGSGSLFNFRRARGSLATPTTTVLGDTIFSIIGQAYDGGGFRASAGIQFLVDTVPVVGSSAGQRISFQTSVNSTRVERMTITSGGFVGIGTSTPTVPLHVYSTNNPGLQVGDGSTGYFRLGDATLKKTSGNFFSFNGDGVQGINNLTIGQDSPDINNRIRVLGGSGNSVNSLTIPTSSGFVGIGSTTPTYLFSVGNNASIDSSGNASTTSLTVNSTATGTTTVQIGDVGKPGCIKIRNTADSGWLYMYASGSSLITSTVSCQ